VECIPILLEEKSAAAAPNFDERIAQELCLAQLVVSVWKKTNDDDTAVRATCVL
jgi:hypothetical protein